jgi:O-antigen/teichoic acid export membrane protein
MLFAGSQLSVYVCLKADRLTRLGGLKVAHSAVTGGTQCALVSISAVGGLALGQVFGLLIMALPALAVLRNALASMSQNAWLRVRASARRFSRYPKFVCPSELVDALANQAPLLAIGSVFSLEVLGAYGFAQRILAAPAALVGQAVGQIFLQRVSRRDTDRSAIKSLMIRVWLSMGALGIVPFAALFIFGGQLFEFLFGTRWLSAGEIAAASAPLLFLRFISSPTSTVYYRLELQSWQLVLAVMALFVRTGAVFAHFFGANIIEVIYLQTAGEILVIGMYNAIAWNRLARRSH